MICNTAGQSDEIIEQVNSAFNGEPIVLIREDLTVENQLIYDEYVNQFMSNITTCIENLDDTVDGARFTDVVIDEETITFDYDTLTTLEKAKVDNFITLIN
jgi:hypothetical protein